MSREEQVSKEKKARLVIDRDEYARKVNVQSVQAFNRYLIHQHQVKKKQSHLTKRTAQLDSLAHSVDNFPNQNGLPTSPLYLNSPQYKVTGALPLSPTATNTTTNNKGPSSFSHMHQALQHSAVMTTIYSKYSNPPDYNLKEYKNRYVTSNDEQYGCALMSKKETSTSGRAAHQARRFNKRKSPYQQFSDAKYNFGVYFNPVMNGL